MKVIFKAAQKIGNRSFPKGDHVLPDSFSSNMGFKKLVASGAVQVMPRDAAAQKIQLSQDMKAVQRAKFARKARVASKSAQAASSAPTRLSSAAEASQPLSQPIQPVSAGAAVQVSKPAAPASALEKGKNK